ncbi:dual oxidase 2-like [Macrobrachium rosenbergii]|uniref:dual oxidase 2-like n=1 Tax=Macrobrachium rosenbergii TaxID=79674 RepID=UPI0034D5F5F2
MRLVSGSFYLACWLLASSAQQNECPPQGDPKERPRPCLWQTDLNKNNEGFRFLDWLIAGCSLSDSGCDKLPSDREVEYEGYDGWYNNLAVPNLGAVDTPLQRLLPTAYSDGVYQPVKRKVNPLQASQLLMNGTNGLYSKAARTAFSVYFGQQVVEEILDAQGRECPPEYFNINIEPGHRYRKNPPYLEQLPFHRTRYDKTSGLSPNNPRQQLNEITPYLDGGLVYGTSKGWADVLRYGADGKLAPGGKLASHSELGEDFPAENVQALPMANPPAPTNHSQYTKQGFTSPVDRFFKLGNPRGNENPFLLTFGILWFRWHNLLAEYFQQKYGHIWSDDRIFNEARKWVIATYQSIVLYDWLPKYMRAEPSKYKGYNPNINPQVSHVFQSAAMRFGHTLVTSGGYLRTQNSKNCHSVASFRLGASEYSGRVTGVRTCNSFWRSPEFFTENRHNFNWFLMGLSSQSSEKEDNIIVEDLRGSVFGPLDFSRRDLMALNIQRGRDHGLPDYNTARKHFGLPTLKSLEVEEFKRVTRTEVDDDVLRKLKLLYKDPSQLDIWPGGLLETTKGPGQLFSKIILDQFERIRDGDRYWFENEENDAFTDEEQSRIRQVKIIDIIQSVTNLIAGEDIQEDPFTAVHPGNDIGGYCQTTLNVTVNCTLVDDNSTTCKYLPQLWDGNTEKCTEVGTYDYFSGSEISFVLSFGIVVLACAGLRAYVIIKAKRMKSIKQVKDSERVSFDELSHKAKERISYMETRDVIVKFVSDSRRIEVVSMKGELLRTIDFTNVEVVIRHSALYMRIVHQVSNHYDLFLMFQDVFYASKYHMGLNNFFERIGLVPNYRQETKEKLRLNFTTVYDREKKLDEFSRVVLSTAFDVSSPEKKSKGGDAKVLPESSDVLFIKITKTELAHQLGMLPDCPFVKQMFSIMDKNKDGFITLREFWNVMVVFATGSQTEKAELLFQLCDMSQTGSISSEDFTSILRSTLSSDGGSQDLGKVTQNILRFFGSVEGQSINFEQFRRFFEQDNILKNIGINFESKKERKPSTFSLYKRQPAENFTQEGREDINAVTEPSTPSLLKKQSPKNFTQEGGEDINPLTDMFSGISNQLRSKEQYYFWKSLYTLVMIGIFLERAYYYLIEQEHGGLRRVASVGVTFTRGAASAMMFTYSTLLVTMCRNLLSKLRSTALHRFFPFDDMVSFHRYVGTWALFWTLMHVVGHAINFYHISTQTPMDLSCLFRDFFRRSHILPKFHYWCWETITGITGVFLTVQTAIIYAFAYKMRRHFFIWFWITHNTYPLFYFLLILHGCGRLVQEPFFFYFFIGPCIAFCFDKLVSMSRSKIRFDVLSAVHLPSNVILLKIRRPANFNYKSGQWVRIASLGISEYEYHPFTLSSSPHEKDLTVHIRAVGPWTYKIKSVYPDKSLMQKDDNYQQIYIDGPFGGSHEMWWNFETVVFVAGGIGVTPFSSILKEIAHKLKGSKSLLNTKRVVFLWITRSEKQFEWMTEILKKVEEVDSNGIIDIHIFITQFRSKYDLRTIVLYLAEQHFQRLSGTSLFTGLRAITHFGRPDFELVFKSIQDNYYAKVIGVFTCGAPSLSEAVDQACHNLNKQRTCTCFKHYYEKF